MMACTAHTARDFVAQLVGIDPIYLPIFARLDEECEAIDMAARNNPVEAARALTKRGAN